MKTILLSTDFSTGAKNAIKFAIHMFKDINVKYVLMNSYYDPPSTNDIVTAPDGALKISSEQNLEKEKAWIENHFQDWKLDIKVLSSYGMLLSNINKAASDIGADFVVINNKTKFDIDSLIMRQKTSSIVTSIDCPVLAVPESETYGGMTNIAFASDLKTFNKPAILDPVKDLVQNLKASLKIFHVSKKETEEVSIESGPVAEQFRSYFSGVEPTYEAFHSKDVSKGLSEFTIQNNCGMLVVVERNRNLFSKLFDSSKSKKISELATVPVLILKD